MDNSIKQRTMSIENQPPPHLHPRYESDGIRQIEKSRTKPMTITVYLFSPLFSQIFFVFFSYPI